MKILLIFVKNLLFLLILLLKLKTNFKYTFLYIKLLLYLFKHYTLKIKSLNLLNNPIDHNIINEIHKYVKNDYDLDPTSRETLATDHQKSVNKIKAIEKKLKKQSNKVRHADTSSNVDLNALNVNSANLNVNSELDLKLRDQLKLCLLYTSPSPRDS